jgi:NAD(P)-dependent dehydrogenase (short-subunit alcohol dehydrogenase family)
MFVRGVEFVVTHEGPDAAGRTPAMRFSSPDAAGPRGAGASATLRAMRTSAAAFALVLTSWLAAPAPAQEPPLPQPAARAVLVTGASSGIGRKTAELLAKSGFFVYATARKESDLRELDAIPNVKAIALDVTKQDQIDAAVKVVRDAGRGLYGLVNNAGVAVLAPLIELREQDLLQQLDVNVLGPYRVTKAFAPLLIESKGRLATTGSISGIVTWAMGGPYTMSKHAVEAFTDVLAQELQPFGVHVSVVEPGNYRSEIMHGMKQRLVDGGYGGKGSLYEKQIDRLIAQPADRTQYKEPDDVAAAFLHALADAQPKRRYMVVPNQREAETTIKSAIARVVQLNEGQPFAYDRDTLVKMLDDALRPK